MMAPLPQVTLACVKVTKTNVCTPLAVPQGFCYLISTYGYDFQVAHHGSSRHLLCHHHRLPVSAHISACFPLFSRAKVWAAQSTSSHSSTGQLSGLGLAEQYANELHDDPHPSRRRWGTPRGRQAPHKSKHSLQGSQMEGTPSTT